MDRLRKPMQWLNKLTSKTNKTVYDDYLPQEFGLLSRPPVTNSRIESPEPITFPKTLAGGTAESRVTADILRATLGRKILLDDHPRYWERRFFNDKAISYFAPVFSHVCLFPHEQREAVMAECTPLFERLEASIRETADAISRGEMTVDNLTPYSRNNTARMKWYLDKLTDLHMTRVNVVKGRYDDRMRNWREAQARVSALEIERCMEDIMLGTVGEKFNPYPGYEAYNPVDESLKYPGQWLPSLGYLF